MKQFYKFIISASIFSLLLLPKISQCQGANPSYGGYYNYGQPYNYGGYSIYGQPLPDYGGSYFNNNGFNSGYPNYSNYGQPQYNQPNYGIPYEPGLNYPNYSQPYNYGGYNTNNSPYNYMNYNQPYNYGGYSIYGQPLPDYGGSYFDNYGGFSQPTYGYDGYGGWNQPYYGGGSSQYYPYYQSSQTQYSGGWDSPYIPSKYADAEEQLDDDDDGEDVSVDVGDMIAIILPGTIWTLDSDDFDDDVLREYTMEIAADGYCCFSFKAKEAGKTTIKLDFDSTTWMSSTASCGDTFEIEITVED